MKLSALYVDCVHPFWRLFGFESNCVTFVKICKSYADQGFAVEKEVFFLAFYGDKAESLVSELFDCTVHEC